MSRDVDISNGRVKSAELAIPLKAPTVPFEGAIYFNTSDDKLYVYRSGSWVSSAAMT